MPDTNQNRPYYPCGHRQCIKEGIWLPVLVIRLVGQYDVEKPVTCAIPMFLCDQHKAEFNPHDVLTTMGKAQLIIKARLARHKKLNWDTLEVQWRRDEEAKRQLTGPDGRPLQ